MKRMLIAAGLAAALTLTSVSAASSPSLFVNGTQLGDEALTVVWDNTTYVSLRTVSSALDSGAEIFWENGCAYVHTDGLTLSARPDDTAITVNGRRQSVPSGIKAAQGRVLVPVRALAQAFGASVLWDPAAYSISLTTGSENDSCYDPDDLYWLSRIISAESQGESMDGKIAVGNVVLNRVASDEFPDTICDVIFDTKWGVQFTPVQNGTIYQTPTEESIEAAKLCLDGVNVIGDSLYFLAPALAQNFWVPQNREYIATIGCHDFYK